MDQRTSIKDREFQPMTDYLRVTIGTEQEMKRFFVAFREIVKAT